MVRVSSGEGEEGPRQPVELVLVVDAGHHPRVEKLGVRHMLPLRDRLLHSLGLRDGRSSLCGRGGDGWHRGFSKAWIGWVKVGREGEKFDVWHGMGAGQEELTAVGSNRNQPLRD